jgi:hypothetical protein
MHTPAHPHVAPETSAIGEHRKHTRDPLIPFTIPVVIAEANPAGRLSVTIDGEQFTPEPISRAKFGSLLDEIIRKRGTALRVEVHEADGSSYTDLLTPPAGVEPEPHQSSLSAADTAEAPALFEVTGTGFVPGEEVAFAPILIHSSARSDGSVRSLVEFDGRVAEVLAYGRVSGTLHVVKAPR